jgi:hypothetical protein
LAHPIATTLFLNPQSPLLPLRLRNVIMGVQVLLFLNPKSPLLPLRLRNV